MARIRYGLVEFSAIALHLAHHLFRRRERVDERRPAEKMRSAYFMSGAACLRQLDAVVVEAPQQRRDRHVEHGELVAQHVLLLGEHRRDLRSGCRVTCWRALLDLLLRALLDRLDRGVNSSCSKRNRNSRARARITGSAGISCGCGKRSSMYSLMMFDSYRMRSRSTSTGSLVVRVHHREVFGLVEQVDVDDLEVHALLVQHDAAALAERAGGARIEFHHGS